jgi:hypothetical protein
VHTGFWRGNVKVKHHLGVVVIDGKIKLKRILQRWKGKVLKGLIFTIIIIIIIIIIILTANGFVPGGSGTTIRHNTQNNTPHSKNTTHKITKTIKDTYCTQ